MNDVDLVMRLNNENAFVWWASKRFYSMIGDGQFGTRAGAALPRGYGLSHYAKYTIDTHRVNITATGSFADGVNVTPLNENASNINNLVFNLDNNTVRITAYAMMESGRDNKPVSTSRDDWEDVRFISLILMTPTSIGGDGGRNVGPVQINMPSGFRIGGVAAHKSSSSGLFAVEEVRVNQARTAAFVTLGPGEILSVKLTRQTGE